MDSFIHNEIYIFLTTLYGGIIIGFVYDIYRIFRYFFKPKKIATFIEDLIFWIIVSLIALIILLFSNWGEIRGYVFLGFISGAFLYHKLLSKIVITIIVHIVRYIINLLKYILGIIFIPFKFIGRCLYKPYYIISKKIRLKYRKAKRIFKLPGRIVHDITKHTKTILFKK